MVVPFESSHVTRNRRRWLGSRPEEACPHECWAPDPSDHALGCGIDDAAVRRLANLADGDVVEREIDLLGRQRQAVKRRP